MDNRWRGDFKEESLLEFAEMFTQEWDFARCRRPDGTYYASPTQTCRKGILVSKEEWEAAVSTKVDGEPKSCSIEKGKRNCVYNWAEGVVAAAIADPSISTVEDILSSPVKEGNEGYMEDIKKRNPAQVEEYLRKFKEEYKKVLGGEEIEQVYILGMKQSLNKEIEELQQGLELKQKKSDVMIKTKSGNFIGVSVKSGSGDTLTNYAANKMLPKSAVEAADATKAGMIRNAGLPTSLDKSRRKEYNALFYGKNEYHDKLNEAIMDNKAEFLKSWKEGLYADTPFPIYSFDGNKFRDNTSRALEGKSLDLVPLPKNDKSATLGYQVTVDGEPQYELGIRWKGNVLVSPNVQTYRINQ